MVRSDAEYDRLLTLYRTRVDAYADMPVGYPQRWRRWCTMLLDRGGELVVPHRAPDADLDELIARAIDFPNPAQLVDGEDGACHRNAAMMWANGQAPMIGTGYALSPDQLWRQHSWAVAGDGTVLETTSEQRLAYVGLCLDAGEPVLSFVLGNAGDVVKRLIGDRTARGREIVAMVRDVRAKQVAATP